MNLPNRYLAYYRLLDIALLAQLIMAADEIAEHTIGRSPLSAELPQPFEALKYVLFAGFGIVVPAVLIFQRWMRDEYCEALWQRAAGTALKALIVLPVPAVLLFSLAIFKDPAMAVGHGAGTLPAAAAGMVRGTIRAGVLVWMFAPAMFTWAFQWHRWRGAR